MRIVNCLYGYLWRGRDNNCNSYLFTNCLEGGKHVLIDPGHIVTPMLREPALDGLIKEIEKDGLRIGDIGLIILTHGHIDHCQAVPDLIKKTKALLYLSEKDKEIAEMMGVKLKLNRYLKEGQLIFEGENKVILEIYYTPGHSPGSISIYWPEKKVLIPGDVIFYRGVGRTDFPTGSIKLLKQSIERLSQLDIEYLLPGHNYNFPPNHPGYLRGKEEIEQNFVFIKRTYF